MNLRDDSHSEPDPGCGVIRAISVHAVVCALDKCRLEANAWQRTLRRGALPCLFHGKQTMHAAQNLMPFLDRLPMHVLI